ncbi:hypothetical protein FB558_6749 [Pseudonocardia kunmingensis]|uniref:Uncharacterized protein n=1 Tax=Pseudonocardia kunmingensis TaxID=630975 RepID=A0A543DAY0_9PSEU|nr:hypothetical protein FB558_6749 [Pseudonocardia kunmingensis]
MSSLRTAEKIPVSSCLHRGLLSRDADPLCVASITLRARL